MIEAMAHAEGFKFAECLTGRFDSAMSLHETDRARACTGFKFIGNTALNLENEGYEVPFGYEDDSRGGRSEWQLHDLLYSREVREAASDPAELAEGQTQC